MKVGKGRGRGKEGKRGRKRERKKDRRNKGKKKRRYVFVEIAQAFMLAGVEGGTLGASMTAVSAQRTGAPCARGLIDLIDRT